MAGLVPAIYVFISVDTKTWMPGTRPDMTSLVGKSHLFPRAQLLNSAD
jgi:hypothetical protein